MEGIAASDSLAAEEVALNWTPSPSTSTATGGSTGPRMPAKFDFVKLTVDDLQGPQNVPSYAKYTYSESGPFTLGTWSAAGGTVQGGQPEPFQTATSIPWDGSDPNNPTAGWFGKVLFKPAVGFTLERDVNVVQITFGTTNLHVAAQGQPGQLRDPGTNNLDSVIDSYANHRAIFFDGNGNGKYDGLDDSLNVTARGPIDAKGIQRGVRRIQMGLVQQAQVIAKNAVYTINKKMFEVKSATEDGQLHWDTSPNPWPSNDSDRYMHPSKLFELTGVTDRAFRWTDDPALGATDPTKFPWIQADGTSIFPDQFNIIFKNYTYFAVGTFDAPSVQTQRLKFSWTFNGSGIIANATNTPAGGQYGVCTGVNAGIVIDAQPQDVRNGDIGGGALGYLGDLWGVGNNEQWDVINL